MTTGAEKRSKYSAKSPAASMGWGAPDAKTIADPAVKQRAAAHPDEPWLWREDWAAGRIRSAGSRDARPLVALGILCVCFVGAVGFLLASSPSTTPAMIVVTALLGITGVTTMVFGVRQTRQRARMGTPILVLESVPIWIGGRLRGRIEWPDPPRHGFTLVLRAVPVYRDYELFGDRPSNRVAISTTSGEVAENMVQRGPGRCTIPVDLEVPKDQPGTGVRVVVGTTHGIPVGWELEVRSKDPGSLIRELFTLPVFARRQEF